MNVKVYAGGTLAYDNLLPVEKGYTMQSILIRERKNTGGSATVLLPANHPLRDGFPAFKTPVEIYRDGVLRWRGRTLPESRDFYCRGKITCEGELCFLQDSTLRPGTYSGDLATVFTSFIDAHNARVEEWKRFAVGNVTVTTDEAVEITLQAGRKTYAEVHDLVTTYGGIILFDSAPDGTRRINWYAEMPYSCNQQISLGVNLTDFNSSVDATGFATRIVPYGALDADGNPITIDVDGKDYVESSEGVALRGIIEASVSYPDISDPEELRAAAQRDVDKAAALPETIKLSALDISRQNLNLEAFRVGQRTKATSAAHKLSGYYDLVAMEEDLVSSGAGSITLTKDSVYCDGAGSTLTGAVSSQGKLNFEKEHGASIASLTEAILGAKGGAVRLLDTDGDKLPDTLYIADNPDPALAKKVWRFNYEGWAGSDTGYNGPFALGATFESGLLADFIKAGVLEGIEIIGEKGTIGGFSMSKTALSAKFRKDYPEFTEEDVTKVRNYWFGTETLTDDEIEKYDVNLNGRLESGDASVMAGMIAGTIPRYSEGVIRIDSTNPKCTISMEITSGYRAGEKLTLGMGFVFSSNIDADKYSCGGAYGYTGTVPVGDKTLTINGGIITGVG